MQWRVAALVAWIIGMILIIVYGVKHLEKYIIASFCLFHLYHIMLVHRKVNRKITGDILIIKNEPVTPGKFILSIGLYCVYAGAYIYIFPAAGIGYLSTLAVIVISGAVVAFLIQKNKVIPFLVINSNELIVNGLTEKRFNLNSLEKISFDGLSEKYTLLFKNSEKLYLRKEQYGETDMENLITVIKNRSGANVILSHNLLKSPVS